ncbi:hypothetical protein, partial [Streptomyces toxytricini]|uniref:hypothetical protein n=1 Tax=Streptomyces toxytricini TaxID=67369 RepID=UPI00341EB361
FGTLLSSQGTDASFVLTRSNTYWGFPPGFRSSFLRFRLYQSLSRFAFRGFRFRAFPFRRHRPYQGFSRSPQLGRSLDGARQRAEILMEISF